MCGIAGYYINDQLNQELIGSMAESIQYRGPDHRGFFADQRICIAHNRLSIIDLSEEANQPFESANGRYIMVYNGEVYNFQELRTELGIQTRTSSDTEVVLEAYVKWGKEFVHKLNGMFAIAIYDRESEALNIWRDRFGIKPICYYWDGKNFAFASEMKALYRLSLPKEIDVNAFGDYLFLEYIPAPKSIFRNYFKLPAGHHLVFEDNDLKTNAYYDILNQIEPLVDASDQSVMEEFGDLFESAVKYRCIADVPVGTFLSGGLDSTSVLKALNQNASDIEAFSIGFNDARFDELAYSKEAARILKNGLQTETVDPSVMLDQMDQVLSYYDEPFAVSSVIPTYTVSKMARKRVKVALAGDGGDELFMGYGHYNWRKRLEKIKGLPAGMRKAAGGLLDKMGSREQRVAKLLEYGNITEDWPHIWSQEQYMFTEQEIGDLLGKPYKHEQLRNSWADIQQKTKDPYLQVSLFDIKHYLADDLLYKVDIASMANSLEVRLPFLDHRLVEFALNLPTSFKIRNGNQKWLLKQYLSGEFSTSFLNRKKGGFGTPIDHWIKSDLKSVIEESIGRDAGSNAAYSAKKAKELFENYQSGSEYLNKRIWALFTFEKWKGQYLH